jgi:cysteinyl-tRNA synthetase, unknown class
MLKRIKILLTLSLQVLLFNGCRSDDPASSIPDLDFREEMRVFVSEISIYSKTLKSDFLIIPQNGVELVTNTGDASGTLSTAYLSAIDAVGREDLFYGYTQDDVATPALDRDAYLALCDLVKANGKKVLVTDYCFTPSKMDDSYSKNFAKGYISFAADQRELDNIPQYPNTPYNQNDSNITDIANSKNFLYLINTSAFSSKKTFLDAIRNTNYDIVLIDLFFDDEAFTASEITSLKTKVNGGSRLVICYMSIGEAEDYRYYWSGLYQKLVYQLNPDWPGNYSVKYWEPAWKSIIYGNDQSYTKKVINAGFDGVYLDIIEAYETFE